MDQLRNIISAIKVIFITLLVFSININYTMAQDKNEMKPEETEVWEPVPQVVTPGSKDQPPSDAVVLFNGQDLSKWQNEEGNPSKWIVKDGYMTMGQSQENIQTKEEFGSIQLHIEWKAPEKVKGDGQGRGNSGVFLQKRFEVQVLDSYKNKTYSNGMAASVYKQHIPLVNAARKPGEWQTYDIIFIAPEFNSDGSLKSPARVTVLWNGILVHHDVELKGPTRYIGYPEYEAYDGKGPLLLQYHGNPVSFRNIWLRKLSERAE